MTRADASGAATADAQSDAENTESEEDDHVMDPSDPRAHGRQNLSARSKQEPSKSRWDSDGDDGAEDESEEVDEDLGVPVQMDDDEEEQKQPAKEAVGVSAEVTEKLKARLSGWAAARFLVPRSERKLPVLEEPPLEPLNDFILSDFGTRFRGGVQVQSTVAQDDDTDSEDGDNDKFQVGAPLFSADGSPLDDKDESAKKTGKDKANDKDKEPKKRRPENRYFITDLATKCFNCGQVGHMSAVCANDKLQKPCYYCALRGHSSFACPHLPCSACMQVGHEFKDCPNKRVKRSISCGLCGRAGHESDDCDTSSRGGLPVTCMVCVEDGHLHCAPIPPPADRRTYCAYCAGNHKISHCRDYVQPATMSFTARLPRSDMKCFVCNTAGHIAAECPKRTSYNNGGGSCFNCGQRGHYASDCPSARGGGGNNSNSRKRGRNEYYAEDDDEDEGYSRGRGGRSYSQRSHTRYEEQYEDDDASEDQYYYVPNGGQSKKKPRLDAALPSYRHSSSNNSGGVGGGGYKSNNRNQRNGNGNGNGGGNGSGDRRRYR